MFDWGTFVSVIVGGFIVAGSSAIGWFWKRGLQRERDAAHIAKLVVFETKEGKEAIVDEYMRVYRELKKKF